MGFASRSALTVLLLGSALCSGRDPARTPAASTTAGGPTGVAAADVAVGASHAPSGYEIVAIYPHDTRAYTQGLFWHDGNLYEGTGRYGTSWLRKVDTQTGEVLQQVSLPSEHFGEGIALLGGRIFQLTWLSKRGFIYDAASFERLGEFRYDPSWLRKVDAQTGEVLQQVSLPSEHFGEGVALLGGRIFQLTWLSKRGFIYDAVSFERLGEFRYDTEGWGLTTDGTHLIMSDGSARLFFLDGNTQHLTRTVRVRDEGKDLDDLNELEYIDGLIYANVWHSDIVFKIDPVSGAVVGRVDFSDLLAGERPPSSEAVLNGIAYNPSSGHLYITGKQWPKLFEIRLIPAEEEQVAARYRITGRAR